MERPRRGSVFETPQVPKDFKIHEAIKVDYESDSGIGKFILYKTGELVIGDFSQQHKGLDLNYRGTQSESGDIMGAGNFATRVEEFDHENNDMKWIDRFNITSWGSTGFKITTPEELTATIETQLKEALKQ